MYDHRPIDDLTNGKAVGEKHLKGIPVICKQRRQISGVVGMGTSARIVMG